MRRKCPPQSFFTCFIFDQVLQFLSGLLGPLSFERVFDDIVLGSQGRLTVSLFSSGVLSISSLRVKLHSFGSMF